MVCPSIKRRVPETFLRHPGRQKKTVQRDIPIVVVSIHHTQLRSCRFINFQTRLRDYRDRQWEKGNKKENIRKDGGCEVRNEVNCDLMGSPYTKEGGGGSVITTGGLRPRGEVVMTSTSLLINTKRIRIG